MGDDEPAVRFAIGEALEALNVATIAAASAKDALARVAEADVVVSDLVAPSSSGRSRQPGAIRARRRGASGSRE